MINTHFHSVRLYLFIYHLLHSILTVTNAILYLVSAAHTFNVNCLYWDHPLTSPLLSCLNLFCDLISVMMISVFCIQLVISNPLQFCCTHSLLHAYIDHPIFIIHSLQHTLSTHCMAFSYELPIFFPEVQPASLKSPFSITDTLFCVFDIYLRGLIF
ncbi:hypothetical protein J3Q64DRAFT_1123497 [Phycomyces blakesleeanus]|uniref:G-protein coupled receptors family 1 profile domain-containing protein n=1 Tax=Phycomyces blakesleeanus TaxID=4837 RepID=A0ABR3AHK4_PHYBL